MEPPGGASRERYVYTYSRRTCAGIPPEESPPEYLMMFMTFKFSNLTLAFNIYSHTVHFEGLYSVTSIIIIVATNFLFVAA